MNPSFYRILFLTAGLLWSSISWAQFEVDNNGENGNPEYLIQDVLLGNGIQLVSYSFKGIAPTQFGYFEGGTSVIGIENGVVFTTGSADEIAQNNDLENTSILNDVNSNDTDLEALVNANTQDAASLEFEFVPAGDSIIFRYVFASEEYPEYVCSGFNDVFGFFLTKVGDPSSKQNIALIPGTDTPVAINNINNGTTGEEAGDEPNCGGPGNPGLENTQYYVDNADASHFIEFDGFTVPMTAVALVECGELYHIKMVVADVIDQQYDSGIFLEAESFYSPAINVNVESLADDGTIIEDCQGAYFDFSRKDGSDTLVVNFDVAGDATRGDSIDQPGIDYVLEQQSVTFLPGEFNKELAIFPIADGIADGGEQVLITIYNISECGDTIPITAELTIQDQIAINTTPTSNEACSSEPATLSMVASGGTPDFTYLWDTGETTDEITVTDTSSRYYVVTITDAAGCSVQDSAQMIVFPLPDVSTNAGNDTTICLNDSVSLIATGAVSYSWSPGIFMDDSTSTNPLIVIDTTTIFDLTGVDINGCVKTDQVTITVAELPIITLSEDSAIVCPDDSISISAEGGIRYTWSPLIDINHADSSAATFYPPANRFYYVTVSDILGCQQIDSVLVRTGTLPDIQATGDTTICAEGIAVLRANGGLSYDWSPIEAIVQSAADSAQISVTDTTWIMVTGVNSDGCSQQDSAIVRTLPYPTSDAGSDTAICLGESVELSGTGGVSYAWTPSISLNDSTLQQPTATPTDTTVYIMSIFNAIGCVGRDTVQIDVRFPYINLSDTFNLCFGDSVLLNVNHVTDALWSPSTQLSQPTSAQTYASPSSSITYQLFATDTFGCSNNDSVHIEVQPLPLVEAGIDVEICLNDSIDLLASGGESYIWSPDSILQSIGEIAKIWPKATQRVYVTATDQFGCMNNDSLLATVLPLPSISLSDDTTICYDIATQLSVIPLTEFEYDWSVNDSIWFDNNATPSVTLLESTQFMVTATDVNSCQSIDSIQVNVQQAAVEIIEGPEQICAFDTALFVALGGVQFDWTIAEITIGDQDSLSTVLDDDSWLIVQSTDSLNCVAFDSVFTEVIPLPNSAIADPDPSCAGDTIIIAAPVNTTHVWTPDSILISAIDNEATYTVPLSAVWIYHTAIDDFGCESTDSALIALHPNDSLALQQVPLVLCAGNEVSISGKYTIDSWSDSTFYITQDGNETIFMPDSSHQVIALGMDANGCSISDSITFVVHSNPLVNTGNDTSICAGSSLIIAPMVQGQNVVNYAWVPTAAVTDPDSMNTPFTLNSATTLILTATNIFGCFGSDTITIDPLSVELAFNDTSLCQGGELAVPVESNFSRNQSQFTWTPEAALEQFSDTSATIIADSTVVISLVVVDQLGCIDSSILTVEVLHAPTPLVDTTMDYRCETVEITLTDLSAATWRNWTANGTSESDEIFTQTLPYASSLPYTLTLYSIDSCGVTISDTIVPQLFDSVFTITMPNVFSPDGDGINDLFEVNVRDDLYECIDFNVYNRWGELMYATGGYQNSWDGRTFSGEIAPAGTYFYMIEVADQLLKGSVTLLRGEEY